MTTETLIRQRLFEGVWHGVLSKQSDHTPVLQLRFHGEVIGTPEVIAEEGEKTWSVSFRLPFECLTDGIQTLVIVDAETGEELAQETLFAGEMVNDDIRAEVLLLRSELDLLKRAFRRHCTES